MRRNVVPALFIIYAGLLLFISWWPFNFRLCAEAVALIEWPPFKLLAPEYWQGGKGDTLKIVTFIPLGILLAVTTIPPVRMGGVMGRALYAGASLGLLIQIGWFFLPGRSVSASAIVLNIIGTMAGASPVCFHYLSHRTLGLMTAVYGACFLVAATWPWQFTLQAIAQPKLLHRIEWLPFQTRFAMWTLKENALNTLITVPLGLLAASYVLRNGAGQRALPTAACVGLSCSLWVEGLQCFLPTRTPSLSDVSLNTLGALLGGAIACYFHRWRMRHRLTHPEITS